MMTNRLLLMYLLANTAYDTLTLSSYLFNTTLQVHDKQFIKCFYA